jgi:hypothetical protein
MTGETINLEPDWAKVREFSQARLRELIAAGEGPGRLADVLYHVALLTNCAETTAAFIEVRDFLADLFLDHGKRQEESERVS